MMSDEGINFAELFGDENEPPEPPKQDDNKIIKDGLDTADLVLNEDSPLDEIEEKKEICLKCGKIFKTAKGLENHITRVHTPIQQDSEEKEEKEESEINFDKFSSEFMKWFTSLKIGDYAQFPDPIKQQVKYNRIGTYTQFMGLIRIFIEKHGIKINGEIKNAE